MIKNTVMQIWILSVRIFLAFLLSKINTQRKKERKNNEFIFKLCKEIK